MNNNRITGVDKLRVVAILGVILIHTTTRVLEKTYYSLSAYSGTLLLNQFARFAVPLFFLISGFVLELNYNDSFNFVEYFKKRFSKILVPYIFWSLVYYYFVYTNNHTGFFYALLSGNASYQLYFIPTLCILYLAFPVIHKLYKYIARPISLITLFIFQIYILRYDYSIHDLMFIEPIRILVLSFGFFVIGVVASRHRETLIKLSSRWRVLMGIFSILLVYYIFREGLNGYLKTYNIHSFYSSWRPSVLLYTFTFSAFLISAVEKFNFHKLAQLSFMVFFVHTLIIEIIWNIIGKFITPYVYFDLIFFILVTGASFLIAGLAHKIPKLSKIVG